MRNVKPFYQFLFHRYLELSMNKKGGNKCRNIKKYNII